MSGLVKTACFPRSVRLLQHADFERVYKLGKRHFEKDMTVFFLRREGARGLRIGFTVSRALGGAVDRNRMRRRLREAVRKQLGDLSVPVDVVMNPKKSLLRAQFSGLLQQTRRAFEVIQKSARAVG